MAAKRRVEAIEARLMEDSEEESEAEEPKSPRTK